MQHRHQQPTHQLNAQLQYRFSNHPQKPKMAESTRDPNGWRGKYLRALHICPPELSFQRTAQTKKQQNPSSKSKTKAPKHSDLPTPSTIQDDCHETTPTTNGTTTTPVTSSTSSSLSANHTPLLKRRNSFEHQFLRSATRVAISHTSRRFRRRCQTEIEEDSDCVSAPIEIPLASRNSRRSQDQDDDDECVPRGFRATSCDDDEPLEEPEECDEPEDEQDIFEMEGVPGAACVKRSGGSSAIPIVSHTRRPTRDGPGIDDDQDDLSASFVPPHQLVEHDEFSYERRYRRRCALRI